MNLISKTELESKNNLFQTLTTVIKKYVSFHLNNLRIRFPNQQNAFLLDTVGFISNLPHELVESFKATLEEIFTADILLHIIDISNPQYEFQKEIVYKVLDEIYPKDYNYKTKIIEVWNKIDLLNNSSFDVQENMNKSEYSVVPISATKKINIQMLYEEITNKLNKDQGKILRKLSVSFEEFDKTLKWMKE